MPTIDREFAEQLLKRLEKQKRPKKYFIAKYQNLMIGNINYFYGNHERHWQALKTSRAAGHIEIIWASERFQKAHPEKIVDEW